MIPSFFLVYLLLVMKQYFWEIQILLSCLHYLREHSYSSWSPCILQRWTILNEYNRQKVYFRNYNFAKGGLRFFYNRFKAQFHHRTEDSKACCNTSSWQLLKRRKNETRRGRIPTHRIEEHTMVHYIISN